MNSEDYSDIILFLFLKEVMQENPAINSALVESGFVLPSFDEEALTVIDEEEIIDEDVEMMAMTKLSNIIDKLDENMQNVLIEKFMEWTS
jgi:hypothetical protein